MSKCNKPPAGWFCTRKPNHEGPCAAIPFKCITAPEYNQMSCSAHQNWIHLYWSFETERECRKKITYLKQKYPQISFSETVEKRTIWINSKIDSGLRYYDLTVTFQAYNLINLI